MLRITKTDIDGGYFTDTMLRIYKGCNSIKLPKVWQPKIMLGQKIGLPSTIEPYLDTVYGFINNQSYEIKSPNTNPPIYNIKPTNKMLVGFSGGKDSVAVALWAKEQGYEVTLYHVIGINKSYPNEVDYAISLAKELGMPIIVKTLKTKGKSDYMDNPVKNQLILAGMVQYGLKHGITNFTLGDFYNDTLEVSNYECNLSDAKEMWDSIEHFFKYSMPAFKYHHIFKNYTECYIQILKIQPALLDKVMGCVAPLRFRQSYKDHNEDKFKIKLLDNRCGSCWKCCAEYLILYDMEVLKEEQRSEDMYNKCIAYLRYIMPREKPFIKDPKALSKTQVADLFRHKDTVNEYRATKGLKPLK